MRILDKYILSRFLYNFLSSFVILIVIFIFQSIWLFIDDLAGKGLGLVIIGKFLFYLMPDLIEKVLPLTVLLSSILTFGSFAENYEFAAMKASGISLQRAMGSLIVFVTFLGFVAFFFANNVIPPAQQKIYNLRKNIGKVKPAAIIEEGVFSDFEGMNIKVNEKHGNNDQFLEKVIIHKKSKTNINTTVIKAKSGELVSSLDSDILQLVLKDGHYYEDVTSKSKTNDNKHPYAKANFNTYTMNIDLSQINDVDLNAESDVSTEKMKNISRLTKDIDSLREDNIKIISAFSKSITTRTGGFLPVKLAADTIKREIKAAPKVKEAILDSLANKKAANKANIKEVNDIIALYNDWQQEQIFSSAKNSVANILNTVRSKKLDIQRRNKIYRLHILSYHKKFALGLSCIILFFVGAPLGAIIRKGGLGLPMVIAIILFLTYYFIGVFAGNYAKEGNIHPILGAWLSTLIMLPLSIFLTKRATADRGLGSFGNVFDVFKNLFKKKKKLTTS